MTISLNCFYELLVTLVTYSVGLVVLLGIQLRSGSSEERLPVDSITYL